MAESRARLLLRGGLLAALTLALAAPGAADVAGRDVAMAKAKAALSRGDGIAAEIALKDAQSQGADRVSIAARMGEALLAQGKPDKAREWLGSGQFAPADTVHGLRMLARLELVQGNMAAAGTALDRALAVDNRNPEVWVDLAQLRYRSGHQLEAIGAVDKALESDASNLRALDFRGLLVRDQFGPEAALAWFEQALLKAPNDGVLLGDYAATLGELGRYKQMLVVTRKMLELGAAEPRAHYLQAVLAARAGNLSLTRAKLNRLGDAIQSMPAALMLSGIVDLEDGNANLAAESFKRLVAMQPQNEGAQLLFARALYGSGQQKAVIERFGAYAASPGASPYILLLVGRAYEDLGEREAAAPLFDRAAAVNAGGLAPAFDFGNAASAPADQAGARVRAALAEGHAVEALAVAERLRADWPGLGASHALAGDAQFAAGNFALAAQRYGEAARVRSDDSLLVRMVLAAAQSGERVAGAQLLTAYLSAHPQSPAAARLAADYAASTGDWARARLLLENLAERGGGRDVRLLGDLAFAQLRVGDSAAALANARKALAIQPASPVAAQALAMALKARREEPELAEALAQRAAKP